MATKNGKQGPIQDLSKYPDRIGEIYTGRNVFITGGSGFLGKVLVEKLLRCTEVKTIYMLIRNKKGKTPQERVKDIFDNPLFDRLKKERPDFLKRVKPIPGDVTEVDLGISEEDRKMLQDEIDFIYHSAASTRFDDTVKVAVRMNTRGTKYMLDLAHQCKKLKLFMHVSTAYAYPKEKVLYEKVYKPPANPHEVLNSINWINEDDPTITQKLLGNCPNTYTFSKALAEGLVAEQLDKLPVVIVRPSIVVPTMREPFAGWCNNLQGPMGLFVGAGKGIIRSMYVNSSSHADFLPADYTINGMVVATWNFLVNDKHHQICNLTSSSEYNITWEEIIEIGRDVIENVIPFNQVVWYPGGSLKKSKIVHEFCFFFFQLIPAIFLDFLLIILGYKPVLYQIQRRIQKGGEMFEYYTTKAWNFSNEKSLGVRPRMNPLEKEKYKIDGEGLVIKDYLTDCVHSLRRVNLKETDEMLPAARRNLKIMYVLDRACKGLIIFAFFYYTYQFLRPILLRAS